VFALWYWRLDGGGPTLRYKKKRFAARAFFFRRCKSRTTNDLNLRAYAGIRISSIISLSPSRRVLHSPDRRAVTGALGEGPGDDPDFDFADYRGFADLRCRGDNIIADF